MAEWRCEAWRRDGKEVTISVDLTGRTPQVPYEELAAWLTENRWTKVDG